MLLLLYLAAALVTRMVLVGGVLAVVQVSVFVLMLVFVVFVVFVVLLVLLVLVLVAVVLVAVVLSAVVEVVEVVVVAMIVVLLSDCPLVVLSFQRISVAEMPVGRVAATLIPPFRRTIFAGAVEPPRHT